MRKAVAALSLLLGLSTPASAEWLLDEGVAIVNPSETNSTIELMAVLCGDPFQVEVYSRGGPVMPEAGEAPADYFYLPNKVRAVIDGRAFPLAAAGSEAAVVLFAEGTKANSYMAPIRLDFIEALKSGAAMTLGFDITPENAADGTPFETHATFPLEGAPPVLDQALAGCR
jgi:hypothetical protein